MANMFDEIQVSMKTYAGECHEQMMIDSHLRNREKGESKLKFQDEIGGLYSICSVLFLKLSVTYYSI